MPLKSTRMVFYLVGGAVRDQQMGRPIMDIDLICDDAEKMVNLLASMKNVAVVRFFKMNSKRPCYRLVNRANPKDHIDLADIREGSLPTDLARRDFTINAMAIRIGPDCQLGEVVDLFDGRDDIKQKTIRVVRPDGFKKDPLRILRAVRFSAELGFSLPPVTIDLIRQNAAKINQVAGERIWAELIRMLSDENSTAVIRQLDELQVLTRIFPEIGDIKDCPQNGYHHLDVWPHSMVVLRHCEKIINCPAIYFNPNADVVNAHLASDHRAALLKLVALIHDVGKPPTRGFDDTTGRITFHNHDKVGAAMVEKIAHRLRLSKKESTYLTTMVAEHLHILSLSQPEVKPSTRMQLFRALKDDTISLIIHGMADVLATRGPQSSRAYRQAYLSWAKQTIGIYPQSIKPLFSPQGDLIRGRDLLSLGVEPGPRMGKILFNIRRAQDDGTVEDRFGALKLAKQMISTTFGKDQKKG